MAYAFPVCSSAILGILEQNSVYLFMANLMFSVLIPFQHDELKPLTKGFTDSLSELGNLNVLMYRQIYSFQLTSQKLKDTQA